MDMQKIAREIGLFETGINLSKVSSSVEVLQKVEASMPLPDEDITTKVQQIAAWLRGFGKSKYMFLTPEILLIEELSKHAESQEEAIIVVPCDLESDAKERQKNNIPRNMKVTILEEPYFPESFFPGNGIIVVCGYSADGRAMVLSDTYRMVDHYSRFLGKKIFLPYIELDTAIRYDGWLEVSQQKLSRKWKAEV